MMKRLKQILAGLLVAVMLVAGLVITPIDAKATESATETVVYQRNEEQQETGVIFVLDEEKYNFKTLWESRTAPTRDGYVFGGWYTKSDTEDDETFSAIRESDAEALEKDTQVWAKFVPAEVLSVRAQLEADTEVEDGTNVAAGKEKQTTYLRLLSGVNGLGYQKVGFDIKYNKKYEETSDTAKNITKVFKKITNAETGTGGLEADDVFGTAATHFSVLRLADIYYYNFNFVIYVRPHWTTLDGTTVYGQGKYVRVIDGFSCNQYISVPVNFLEGSAVAAGQLEMTYDSNTLELVTVAGKCFDEGTLMTEMSYYNDKNTIKIVGNIAEAPAENTKGVEPETDIYANVWFKVKDGVNTSNIDDLTFEMKNLIFCDWDEEEITNVKAWDFKYIVVKDDLELLRTAISGKNLSILGDSISTFGNYSNGAAAETTNRNISRNEAWYDISVSSKENRLDDVNKTWWMSTANSTGLNILVNNSYSGDQVARFGMERALQLHDDTAPNAGTEPDIIAVFMGINDLRYNYGLGEYSEDLYNTVIQYNGDGTYFYKGIDVGESLYTFGGEKGNAENRMPFAEAYIAMVHKIITRYKDAKVFLFTLLPTDSQVSNVGDIEKYNNIIRAVASHYSQDDVHLVDLYKDSGITIDNISMYDTEAVGDRLHPNAAGMRLIKNTFINALKEQYLN